MEKILAESKRSSSVAPAGCGKTQLIAKAVANHGGPRELILTHTHAGVDALRNRFVKLGAVASRYHVDTIAGWSLHVASSFPRTSTLPGYQPKTNEEYKAVYDSATRLVQLSPIQEILESSYSGIYVDEYQDCTLEQHELNKSLSETLPCRIVGDPLQGIFGFGANEIVDWDRHVIPHFDTLPGPTVPWRWKDTNEELGVWLQSVRQRLESEQDLDLRDAPINLVIGSTDPQQILRTCMSTADYGEKVIVIKQWPRQCYDLAKRLSGRYSCVEAIEAEDLYNAAAQIDSTNGMARAVAVIDFAKKCMTQGSKLNSIRNALIAGRRPAVRTNLDQCSALMAVVDDERMGLIIHALDSIAKIPGSIIYRRELLHEMKRALHAVTCGEAECLEDAAWIIRERTRRIGRRLPRYAVGTTLLVKGLEFDHAIVFDADSLDARNLYVALTRGSKSLTIVSNTEVLQPHLN